MNERTTIAVHLLDEGDEEDTFIALGTGRTFGDVYEAFQKERSFLEKHNVPHPLLFSSRFVIIDETLNEAIWNDTAESNNPFCGQRVLLDRVETVRVKPSVPSNYAVWHKERSNAKKEEIMKRLPIQATDLVPPALDAVEQGLFWEYLSQDVDEQWELVVEQEKQQCENCGAFSLLQTNHTLQFQRDSFNQRGQGYFTEEKKYGTLSKKVRSKRVEIVFTFFIR